MALSNRTAHTQKQSFRIKWGTADHGTWYLYPNHDVENPELEYIFETKQERITVLLNTEYKNNVYSHQ